MMYGHSHSKYIIKTEASQMPFSQKLLLIWHQLR